MPAHRRDLGLVFQSHALFPHLTVAGNVGFGLVLREVVPGEIKRRVGRCSNVGSSGLKSEAFDRSLAASSSASPLPARSFSTSALAPGRAAIKSRS